MMEKLFKSPFDLGNYFNIFQYSCVKCWLLGKSHKFHKMLMSHCLTITRPLSVFFINREMLFFFFLTLFSVFYSIWAPFPAPSFPLYFSAHPSPCWLSWTSRSPWHLISNLIISSQSLESSFLLAACTLQLSLFSAEWFPGSLETHIHSSLPSASSIILDGIGKDGSQETKRFWGRKERSKLKMEISAEC